MRRENGNGKWREPPSRPGGHPSPKGGRDVQRVSGVVFTSPEAAHHQLNMAAMSTLPRILAPSGGKMSRQRQKGGFAERMKPAKTNSPKYIISRAREHRRSMTDSERLLWSRLKNQQVCGLRFRRQYPVGRYIVDFCCPERALIIEVDGLAHDTTVEYDANREGDLSASGYTILRFTNDDIEKSLQYVIRRIIALAMIDEVV